MNARPTPIVFLYLFFIRCMTFSAQALIFYHWQYLHNLNIDSGMDQTKYNEMYARFRMQGTDPNQHVRDHACAEIWELRKSALRQEGILSEEQRKSLWRLGQDIKDKGPLPKVRQTRAMRRSNITCLEASGMREVRHPQLPVRTNDDKPAAAVSSAKPKSAVTSNDNS